MPKYQYSCRECGYTFEEILAVNDRDDPLKEVCDCGGTYYRHCGNAGGFRLEGRGWAADGYGSTLGDAENFKASSQNMPKPY